MCFRGSQTLSLATDNNTFHHHNRNLAIFTAPCGDGNAPQFCKYAQMYNCHQFGVHYQIFLTAARMNDCIKMPVQPWQKGVGEKKITKSI